MADNDKTREELIAENAALLQKVAALEASERRYRTIMLSRQGTPIPTSPGTSTIRDGSGVSRCLAAVVTDITAGPRTEESLRQSERRFRNYFEQGLIGMAMTSVDKRWLEVNDRLCEIVGYSREELHQKSWAELTHPDDLEENLRLFDQLLAGEIEKFIFNKRYVKKDRSIVYTKIYTRAFRMDDGRIDHIVVLVEDITAQMRAEEALRQSEEKYRTLVEMSPDAVIMTDLEGHVTLASQQAVKLYEADNVGELLGRNPLDFFAPEDQRKFLRNLRRTSDVGVTRDIEYAFLKKDGARISGEVSAAAIRDASGASTGFVAIIRDITERRKAHEALLRERGTLRHMLRASDHERQLIAYDIHDGLAQELAGAMMQFQIYAHARNENPDESAKAFEIGMRMLQQSHVETRRLISGVRPPILDESGVVAAIVHLVYDPAFDHGPKIHFRNRVTFQRLAPVLENVIYRIVQEGLTNARNHSRSAKILVSLKQRNDRLRIEIRDWGVGFDPKTVHENRFGLQGIRERARLLGGKCNVISEPGKGTSIAVELPVAEREAE